MCHLLCKMALAVVYFLEQQLISHTLKKKKSITWSIYGVAEARRASVLTRCFNVTDWS